MLCALATSALGPCEKSEVKHSHTAGVQHAGWPGTYGVE